MTDAPDPAALLDHTVDKVAVVDEDGRFRYVNEAARRTLGYEPSALVGEDAFSYIHPEEREAIRSAFTSVVGADGGVVERTAEFRFRHAEGGWVWLESRVSNLTDSAIGGYVISSRDVTERVEAERQRTAVATRLREIAAKTSEVLWMFSADWEELLFVNPAVEDVYGLDRAALEADPRSFIEHVHPDDRERVREVMEQLSAGEPADVEYRVDPTDDYGTWVWAQGEPIVVDGEVVRVVGFSRDITDRRHRERQLSVMDTLLRHTIRTHVNLVQGHAEYVSEAAGQRGLADDREEVARRAGEIAAAADRLLQSAEKQREVIDLVSGHARTAPIDLAAVVEASVDECRERNPAAMVTAAVPAGLRVQAVDQLSLAIEELLENAVEHAGGRPTIRIEAHRSDGSVHLNVKDRGPTIPEAEYEVLVGDVEISELSHSSGLGLWLVYWTVERSGGELSFADRPGGGNQITLHLPLAE